MGRLNDATERVRAPRSTGAPPADLPAGTQVGRYIVEGIAGRGGMGIVYLGHDPQLDRRVALKLLLPHDDNAQSLVDEARALAKLTDPHVVAVYDAGEHDGRVFIAMQYVDGETLDRALERRRPSPQHVLAWFVDAGKGLAAAHAAGLVHRDFKPSNVLVDGKGRVAVTDFGIAHDSRRVPHHIGVMSGTPAYMAPEQYEGKAPTQASDQFSFCVALWQALFGRHPFLVGDPGAMSPQEIGAAIVEAGLQAPQRARQVDAKVVAALTRGLARDPAERWPSITELITALAPKPRPRVWPIVAVGAAAAAVAGGVVWILATGATAPTCEQRTASRLAAAWQPSHATAIAARFVASGRSYAGNATRVVTSALDRYASRWGALAADVCAAPAATELIERRRACLDTRLDALRALTSLLAGETRREFVDRAQAMVDGLPDLGDCVGETLPGTPPPAIASEVAAVERKLAAAEALGNAGDYTQSLATAQQALTEADRLGWPPVQTRAHYLIGRVSYSLVRPSRDDLLEAARIASAHGLDRDAARALAQAQQAAGVDLPADGLAAIAPLARAAAERTQDKALIATAQIKYARGLGRLRKWKDALAGCRAGLELARTLDRSDVLEEAHHCMFETLLPVAGYAELEPMLEQMIAARTGELGADHPVIADYLIARAGMRRRKGELAEARQDAERSLAIRRHVYGDRHFKIAEGLSELSDVVFAEGKTAEADKLNREALAMLGDSEQLSTRIGLTISIATDECTRGDRKVCLQQFEQLERFVRDRLGNRSLELAVVLANYGQFKATQEPEAGLALIAESRQIFEHLGDRRTAATGIAAAIIAARAKRWQDVVNLAEETLPLVENAAELEPTARTKWLLARALHQLHRDPDRARALATHARELFSKLGPQFAETVADIDAMLGKPKPRKR